jgi:hypothetical protein
MRDDKRGLGGGHVGGRLLDAEFAEDWEGEEGVGEKGGLGGSPFASVGGIAATSRAQETHDQSGR